MATIYKDLDTIFTIVHIDYNQVIIEVKADTPLVVAMFPFVTSQMNYITVTRGREHVFTIINKDGSTKSFHWGERSVDCINESTKMLKANVLRFIQDNGIILDYNGQKINEVKIYFNSNYKKWQLSLSGICYWSYKATNVMEMIEECEAFVEANRWIIRDAGFDVYVAHDYEVHLK